MARIRGLNQLTDSQLNDLVVAALTLQSDWQESTPCRTEMAAVAALDEIVRRHRKRRLEGCTCRSCFGRWSREVLEVTPYGGD